MKKIFFIPFYFIILSLSAQVKIGKNLTNQASNSSFQVEGNTTNEQLVVFKNGQVSIGTITPDPNAILDVSSTTKGFMPPRLTTDERELITEPSSGMLIYNTETSCVEIYNGTLSKWMALCGEDAAGSAQFTVDCGTANIQGNYTVGVPLDSTNFVSIFVNVTKIGSYNLVVNAGSMIFTTSGNFTSLGIQEIILNGQGKPTNVGFYSISLIIGDELCTAMINVANGVATVTSCHTATTYEYGYWFNSYAPWVNGAIFPDDILLPSSEDPNNSLTASLTGIAYSTPTAQVYGLQTSTVNGMTLYGPTNGTFSSATPASLQLEVIGQPILAGSWTIPYKINSYATTCNVTIPVRSGSNYITSVTTTGASNSPQPTGVANSCWKDITYTVGTYNISGAPFEGKTLFRTTTVNGIYFEGEALDYTTGTGKLVTLYSVGTPISTGTFTYTFQVSSSNTAFISRSFTFTFTQPTNFPDITTCTDLGTWWTNQYIKASNAAASDNFGGKLSSTTISLPTSLSTSALGMAAKMSANGLTLVVGAPNEDSNSQADPANNSSANSGAVYVFHRVNTAMDFVQQAYIKENSVQAGNLFGSSVDISDDGNRIVIGAPYNDKTESGTTAANSGIAYVYSRSGSTWSRTSILYNNFWQNLDTEPVNDYFGGAVAISGNGLVIAVGSAFEDTDFVGYNNNTINQLKSNSGTVMVYNPDGSYIDGFVKSDNIDAEDLFGAAITLNYDGSILVVGAPGEDGSGKNTNPQYNNNALDAGAVYTFIRSGNAYNFESYLKPNNTRSSMRFGFSVDISTTNRLVIGAPGEGRNAADNAALLNSGALYVYDRSGSTWTFNKRLKTNNPSTSDYFGWSVAISTDGTMIYGGAPGEDSSISPATCTDPPDNALSSGSGAIYSFGISNGSFSQGKLFKPVTNGTLGATAGDTFGMNVSCSSNGKIIAYGSGYEDGNANYVNGPVNNSATDAGCVVVVHAP